MQPINVTITVEPRHIPKLICCDYSNESSDSLYDPEIARVIAETLGVQEFLFQPERIHELRRMLWQQDFSSTEPLAFRPAS